MLHNARHEFREINFTGQNTGHFPGILLDRRGSWKEHVVRRLDKATK